MKPDCIQDNDVCIDLPTLSLNTYEPDLPGFDTVLKLGSKGAPESTQTVALQPEVNISTNYYTRREEEGEEGGTSVTTYCLQGGRN